MGGSTGSIQPGMEKTGIFIENAASLFLLSKTEHRTTPHVGGEAGIGLSSNEWEMTGQQHRDLMQALLCSSNLPLFTLKMLRISTSEFNLRRDSGLMKEFLFTFSATHPSTLCASSRLNKHVECITSHEPFAKFGT